MRRDVGCFLLLNRIGHDALFRSGLWQLAFVRCSFGELFGVVAIRVGECLLLNENEGTSLPEAP